MAETSPNKLARNYTLIGLFLFAAPSILLQLWTGIYQIFDTAIATNFNSTATLSAINIVYPAQAVVEAIAFLFSGGSAARMVITMQCVGLPAVSSHIWKPSWMV